MTLPTYDTTTIENQQDFIQFLAFFTQSYQVEGNSWENNNLADFLTAMLSYSEDIEGYYNNVHHQDISHINSWRIFADILMASAIYE